jgi:MoaA/NifB/PqqE/SkfB family radical SAM enzyme
MIPCTRVGIDVTRKCNLHCLHCFYRWESNFGAHEDRSLSDVITEAVAAKARGCNHAVIVGQGEPCLWPPLVDAVKEFGQMGMTSSIITNGTAPIKKYDELRLVGLNHLHISAHDIGHPYDEIVGVEGACHKKNVLLSWLFQVDWPWRMNMSVQKTNYRNVVENAEYCVEYGAKHIVALGFLPHYGWHDDFKNRLYTVAVDPAQAAPYLDKLRKVMGQHSDVMFTIRYQPMCLLEPESWKYVSNARYVVYENTEWDYGTAGMTEAQRWAAALDIGAVGIPGEPCCNCDLLMHCGGWNRTMYAAFPRCGIHAIKDPSISQEPGWLHDQNKANSWKGWF